MSWFRRKKPVLRFRDDCPACGWSFEIYFVHTPTARPWHLKWIPEEQALQIHCPSCDYTWKRLAEDPDAAFRLGTRFEEKS